MHYTIVTVAVSIVMLMVSLQSVFASPPSIVTTTKIIRSCSLFPCRRCVVAAGAFSLSPTVKRIQDRIKPKLRSKVISTCTYNKHTSSSYTFAVRTKVYAKHAIPNSLFTSYAISGDGDTDKTSNMKPLISQHILSETTIYNILHSSIKLLENHSIPEPDESVIHLLSHALNLDWETGYQQLRDVLKMSSPFPSSIDNNNSIHFQSQSIFQLGQQTLSPEQQTLYRSLLERRLQYEPLQYILGQWDFHYLTGLTIRKPMLCPRPETEELVELVLANIDQLIKKQQNGKAREERRRIRILDVGCGTGAIGLAIAYRYPKDVQVVALDVLPEAVELSNENAIKFLSGLVGNSKNAKEDVDSLYQAILCSAKEFTNIKCKQQKYEMNFDMVVSNPPYIPMSDMQDLSTDVVGYESHDALCGGDDGLNVVRDIVHRLPEWVAQEQSVDEERYCWMEVDDSHPKMLAQWLAPGSKESRSLGVEYCTTYRDFRGCDRFVKLSTISIRQDTGSTSAAIHPEHDCEKDTIRVRIWQALASGEELSMTQLCNRVGMRNNRGDIISHLKHVEIQAKTIRNKSEEWRIRRGLMPSGAKKLRLKRRRGAKNEEYIKLV